MRINLKEEYPNQIDKLDDCPRGMPFPDRVWIITPILARLTLLTLLDYVEKLEEKIEDLKSRLNITSSNSSKPPSSDSLRAMKNRKKSPVVTGRKKGGQMGHEGKSRDMLPVEEVDGIIDYYPEECNHCGHPLKIDIKNRNFIRHQVQEIELIKSSTKEYRLHEMYCRECKKKTRVNWPSEVPRSSFGINVQSVISLLTGKYRLSKRECKELMKDVMGVEISTGSIIALEQSTGKALTKPVEEAVNYIKRSDVVNTDETGWRNSNKLSWLWTAVTKCLSVFSMSKHRDKKTLTTLVGKDFSGIIVSDRYSAYNLFPPEQRGLCWAHLKRDFTALAERTGFSKQIGTELLKVEEKVFNLWNKFKSKEFSRTQLQGFMTPIIANMDEILQHGFDSEDRKVARFCKNLIKLRPALWTFLYVEGVEPTNNSAERALRPAVLARKGSFGSQSDRGASFTEKIYTVVATCKKQKRNVLQFLVDACKADLYDSSPPSLIPLMHNTS